MSPPQRPNILLILADDLGNNDLGAFGDGSASSPNIDALAREGVRIRRHYAYATCRPARVALLSGMSASLSGVPPHFRGMTPEWQTLPEALGEAGYATYHVGKWHLGSAQESLPHKQGFDDWFGFLSALETRNGSLEKPGKSYLDPWLQGRHEPSRQWPGHLTDILTQRAVDKIAELSSRDQPWFINLWYFSPHGPITTTLEYAARFSGTPEGEYLAMVAHLDASVGRLMAALEASGVRDNTLVVFLSDNGGTNKLRNNNAPFHGKKTNFLEGGLRTPLIINLPGKIVPADVQEAVFIRDVMPTVLGYAATPVPNYVEGRDIRPLLDGKPITADSPHYWDFRVDGFEDYGIMDTDAGLLINSVEFQRWDAAKGMFDEPAKVKQGDFDEIVGRYHEWRRKVRLVNLQFTGEKSGVRQYSGDSFRRTPGYGGWSLQVPVQFDNGQVHIEQPGLFSVHVAGGLVEVELPGHGFSAPVPAGQPQCQLLTLATYYKWKERKHVASAARAALYLGDVLLQEVKFKVWPDVLVEALPPTSIRGGAGIPVIVNDILEESLEEHYQLAVDGRSSPAAPDGDCSGIH